MEILPIVGLAILLAGAFLLWWGRRTRASTGVPAGEVVYSDMGAREEVDAPLISRRHGLVGRPDYLVRSRVEGRAVLIPVEVKSGRRPNYPAEGHILQLAAYCILVEDVHGQRPAYGLLRYADATLKIPFTAALEREVLAAATAIRQARDADFVARSHHAPGRCRSCGYRDACGEEAL